MKIHLLAFGPAKDWLGNSQQEIDIPEGMQLFEFCEWLKSRYRNIPRTAPYAIALNQNYVEPNSQTKLEPKDEIAIIPPVSGG